MRESKKYKSQIGIYCLTLILISYLTAGCNDKNDTEKNSKIDFYENGNIKTVKIENKLTHNFQTIWFDKNGNVDSIKNVKDSALEGQSIFFHKNGNIENSTNFRNNKRNGHAFTFYEDGALKNHRFWTHGKRNGYTTDFYQDSIGTLKNIYFYNDDTVTWWRQASRPSLGISISPSNP